MGISIKRGESVFFLFKGEKTEYNSQMLPRMYKSREQAKKNSDLTQDGRELVEYAPIRRGKWAWITDDDVMCTACGEINNTDDNADAGLDIWKFCPKCGAKMDKE